MRFTRMRQRLLAGGTGVVAVAIASACSAGTTGTDGNAAPGYATLADGALPAGGTLGLRTHIDIGAATGLDPQPADVATSWQLLSLVYETLVTIGPNFEIRPGLARSWTTPDPTTYEFTLRDGVRFSNGRAMTADDVVGSLERLLDSQSFWKGQLGPIESVTKTGRLGVRVTLTAPYAPFLAALANVPASVLPMKEIKDGSVRPESTMVGTGPFVVASHRQDVSWSFKRNDRYWDRGKPALAGVDVTIAPEENARVAALQNRSATMVSLGNVDSRATLAGVANVKVVTQATTDFYYLMLNTRKAGSPFAHPRVRQAINIALNRGQLSDVALGGQGKPTAVTPAGLPGACDPGGVPSARAGGVERAKALLAQTGAGNRPITLSVYSTQPAPAVAQVIQQNLREIGITVRIEQTDEATWAGKVYADKPAFDAALSWFAGYADPAMVMRWWNPARGGFNVGFMTPDPALNRLIDRAGEQPKGPGRDRALAQVCAAVDRDAQMIPLVTRPATTAYRTDAISPTFYAVEGYGNTLRSLADLRIRNAE